MTTITKTTTLFLSYSGLLEVVRSGVVSIDNLDGAMFFFGCTREQMLAGDDTDDVYRSVRLVIDKAEADGRVVWRKPRQMAAWGQLNAMLSARDLPVFVNGGVFDCTYQGMVEAVSDQGLPYEVIWTG